MAVDKHKLKRKHCSLQLSIGFDQQGDACIYVQRLSPNGDVGNYLTEAELQDILPVWQQGLDIDGYDAYCSGE